MIIDMYSHILPKRFMEKYRERISGADDSARSPYQRRGNTKERYDIDLRIEVLGKFPGLVQVLTPTRYGMLTNLKNEDAVYLSSTYNDALAELVNKYPDQFIAAVALLQYQDIDATLKEIDRAINDLGFKGIAITTPVNGQSLDSPGLLAIYEKMHVLDLPIWIHPVREYGDPDYQNEAVSKYGLFQVYGWPYQTTLAMARLVCSGIMGRFPGLKVITHHAGAMISFFAGRIHMLEHPYENIDATDLSQKDKSPDDYFRMFYNDTALYGNTPALMCAHSFFGAGHMVFGTDYPYGPRFGETYTRLAIEAVEKMDIPAADQQLIFEGNARKLLHLNK